MKPGTQYASNHTEFRDLLDDFGLTQCVIDPTRGPNTLDLIATNLPEQISRVKVIPGISDHEIVFMELAVRPNYRKQPRRIVWLYNKADWTGMADYLTPRLARIEKAYTPSPDDLWNQIKSEITEAMSIYIPQRLTRRKDSRPWIDKKLHQLIKKKRNLYKRCKKRGSLHLEKRYNMYRHVVQKMLRKQHSEYVNRMFTDEEKTKAELSKHFWTFIKHKRSAAVSTVGPLKKDNRLITSAKDRAEILNEQFVSVFSLPSEKTDYARLTVDSTMDDIVIDEKGVLKQLKTLNPYKAAGPDGISPRVLRELAEVLAAPLTTLFQTSLDKGAVPQDWKTALVSPAYKKGEKYTAANYRPISLTCVTCKVLEHILTSQLMRFAENRKIFHPNQHGFRKHHGCEKQLIELTSDIANTLDDGEETVACVLDFSKAFDKVNHNKLLLKLAQYGVSYQLVSWIDDFLTGRTQRVVVDGEQSSEAAVTSGVPQGSVIGPTMFLFYINDLPDNLRCEVRLFADDTIIYNTASNHQILQEDLLKLENWENTWDMEFHPSKCSQITFSRKRQPSDQPLHLHDTLIPKTESIKYLGVTLDTKNNWNMHVNNTAARGNSTLGFIKRNVLTTSENVKATAYKQLVRPVLEYASAAWDSVSDTAAKCLEAVQRRAARFICGIRRTDRKTSTTGLMQRLNLPPLAQRRTERRLNIFSQYHHSDNATINKYICKATFSSSRRHPEQYFIPQSSTIHHQRSFFIRTAKDWNILPDSSSLLRPPSA